MPREEFSKVEFLFNLTYVFYKTRWLWHDS